MIVAQDENTKLLCVALLNVWWRIRNKKNAGEREVASDSVLHQIRVMASDFELCLADNKKVKQAVEDK